MSTRAVEAAELSQPDRVFLSAEWHNLFMLNYEVAPGLLKEYVPRGTELDDFHGSTFLSLVGFRFLRTRLLCIFSVPCHSNFSEINLRFYVRRQTGSECRRGVVFIREIVPKQLVVTLARLAYGENYICRPVQHHITEGEIGKTTEYEWKSKGKRCRFFAHITGNPSRPAVGTLQEFITEHYWRYSMRGGSRAFEYRVSHAPWPVWSSEVACFEGDGTSTYGKQLGHILSGTPDSAFVAEGSPVLVHTGRIIA